MVQQNQFNGDVEMRHVPSSLKQPLEAALPEGTAIVTVHPYTQRPSSPSDSVANQSLQVRQEDTLVPVCPTGAAESDPLLQARYRELAKHYLRSLPALFTKFTGLFSHIAWAPTWPQRWNARDLPSRSQLCREMGASCGDSLRRCHSCADRHLAMTLRAGHKGHSFACWLGVTNFWLPIIVRGRFVGLAFVQALAQKKPRPGKTEAPDGTASGNAAGRGHRPARSRKRMSRLQFAEAARLLRLVVHHVETSAVADLRKNDLSRAQQALLELQTVATRLRTELNGLVPAFNKTAPVLEPENHTDRLVRSALEYIHAHFAEPLTLRQYARQLRLNPAYLSAQFSRAVGTPFKAYLTELRVEKACALLSDPTKTVAEVAYAVGYASANRFRLAFKQMTRLSPREWRETLRMEPSNPS